MFISFVLIIKNIRPSYPGNWDKINIGMTSQEVKNIIPKIETTLRDIKGFDQVAIDYGDKYWQIQISYDQKFTVNKIEKKFIYRPLGLFNKSILIKEN